VKIMDVKCPSSGEARKTLWENFHHLTERDEVKFVLSSEEDYRTRRKWRQRTAAKGNGASSSLPRSGSSRPSGSPVG
jgi:hypothetical protein